MAVSARAMVGPLRQHPSMGGWWFVDWLNRWFTEWAESPVGSILLFLAVFLTRIAIDQWSRKREARKHRKRKGVSHG